MRPEATPAHAAWAPADLVRQRAAAAAPAANGPPPPPAPDPVDALVAEAYRHGYDEGRLEGEHAEQARLRSAVQAAEEALDALRDGELRWTGMIEENVVAVALAVARHVIGREAAADPQVVAALARKAIGEFQLDRQLRIRVHPQDLQLLQSAGDGDHVELDLAEGRELHWIPDATISRGGCVVEGRERIVDGRVDTALERVYRRLTYTNA